MSSQVYKAELIDKVFFVRWISAPGKQEADEVFAKIQEAYAKLGQQKMVLVTATAPMRAMPGKEQRDYLNNKMAEVRPCFSEWNIVVEGNEFQHNLQRALIQGMLIITRVYEGTFARLHKTPDTIAPRISEALNADGQQIIAKARSLGLVV